MSINLTQHWHKIQTKLFPYLEKEVGIYTAKHQELATAIEFARVSELIRSYNGCVGRPEEDRTNLAHAFIAKAIYKLPTTVLLIDKLQCDPVLRRLCGWERKSQIPSESTFSRAFAEFAKQNLAGRLHEAVIAKYHSDRLIGHISRDSTAIAAREKANTSPKSKKAPRRHGRPKQGEVRAKPEPTRLERQVNMNLKEMLNDLPKLCDIGCKKNSKGYTESWRGYKLHIDTADGDIPISALLTSASLHDSQVALPLANLTEQRVTHLYDLMDAAYDAENIRNYSTQKGRVALIDFNRRGPKDARRFAPYEAKRYKIRSSAERVNSNLKDNFGGMFIRVKGHAKVFSHLMFGILALTISQTLRLIT
jgi:hypothetical protein